jgi:transcription elongation factor GreA
VTFPLAARAATLSGMPETHHLSQATFDRLSEELEELTTVGRTDIARKIQAARELGDLSENGDYHAAKEEQGKMEARIRHLTALVENAEIVEGGGTDKVQHGSIVSLCYEGDEEPERFLIGSIEERHGDVDVISPKSPLGLALLGARVGDVVDFEAPGGILKVEVVDIED